MTIRTAVWGDGKAMGRLFADARPTEQGMGDAELAASLAAFGLRME